MHPAIIGTVRSLIVDVAMGQMIPRSTERIFSFVFKVVKIVKFSAIIHRSRIRYLSKKIREF